MKALEKYKIEQLFEKHKGFLHKQDLQKEGIESSVLAELLEKDWVILLHNSTYKWANYEPESELIEVQQILPDGVFCLATAWAFYELSTHTPSEYHVAFPDNKRPTLPDYPPIQTYHWRSHIWEIGITEKTLGNHHIKIYDLERCVCDAVRFRYKKGMDICKEVLQNYVRNPSRQPDLALDYAQVLKIKEPLKNYLEILL
jgi:predicted transcriptional regulator of viral defense system